LLLLQLALLG
jgi:hypothetical protein